MNFIKRLFVPNITFKETDWIEEQKYKTLSAILSLTVFILIFFIILRFMQGNIYMVKVNAIGTIVFGTVALLLRFNPKSYDLISRIFILTTFAMASINMNLAVHGSRAIWLASIIVATFYFRDKKEGIVWTFIFVILTLVGEYYSSLANANNLSVIDYSTLIVNFLLIAMIMTWYEKLKTRDKESLIRQKKVLEKTVAQRTRELEDKIITDELTGLYNRRYLYEVSDKVLKSSKRDHKKFMFVMMDVDNFKLYNDNYGHHAGDEGLKAIGHIIKSSLTRGSDYSFRVGGEEFAFIIQEEDLEKVIDHVESIREKIEALGFEHTYNEHYGVMTASFGIEVVKPEDNRDMDNIYKAADKKLYKAKADGRNKTVY